MKTNTLFTILFTLLIFLACNSKEEGTMPMEETPPIPEKPTLPDPEPQDNFIRGADLSYVNEMLDCAALYYDNSGSQKDPYTIFKEAGTNLVRLRLWHNPDWSAYSNYSDVRLAISRAKSQGMEVLLDFHYSDDWADPAKQVVPEAWIGVVNNTEVLADSVYNYTLDILTRLNAADLLPEYVQVGNETNAEILQDPNGTYNSINWTRNAKLINKGIQAVRDAAQIFNAEIEIMLHVAQPENAIWWFDEATQNGISDYDWIAISYYPKWSSYSLNELPNAVQTLRNTYGKRFMVVETAYPFTMENNDPANNILGSDALIPGYPATEQGQLKYLKDLETAIKTNGGEGLVYWEPAWVSTSCNTQWGQGSHWDNATLFDHDNRANPGMTYYRGE